MSFLNSTIDEAVRSADALVLELLAHDSSHGPAEAGPPRGEKIEACPAVTRRGGRA